MYLTTFLYTLKNDLIPQYTPKLFEGKVDFRFRNLKKTSHKTVICL